MAGPLRITNPIPRAITDPEELRSTIKEFDLVPYYGTTTRSSHNFLELLCDLYELSGSQNAVINDLKSFCFEGDVDIVRRPRKGLRQELDDLPEPEKLQAVDAIEAVGLDLLQMISITQKQFVNYKVTGNAYLRYREIMVGDTKTVTLQAVHPKNVMYIQSEPGEIRTVVITEKFDQGYWVKYPPDVVNVYPAFSEVSGGRETVIHIKNEVDESTWYGRPDSIGSFLWQFAEFQTANLTCKVMGTETTAKYILAYQAPDPNEIAEEDDIQAIHNANMNRIRQLATNEGDYMDAKTIVGFQYSFDGQSPELLALDVNRDSTYQKEAVNEASSYIYASHRWAKELSGFTQTGAGIGANILIDLFKVKDETVIRPFQRLFENEWCIVFDLIAEFTGSDILATTSIRFSNKIKELAESLSDGNNATPDAGGSQNPIENQPALSEL